MAARRARMALHADGPSARPDQAPSRDESVRGHARPGAALGAPPVTVAIVGHRGAGKTELVELLLERGRVVREAGTVAEGTTLLDFDAESRAHRQSLELGCAWLEWDGRLVQIVDTPGAAFAATGRDLAIASADLAVVVVDGAAGAQHGTRDALAAARRLGVPAIVVVAKADRTLALPALTAADLGVASVGWAYLPFEDDRGTLCGLVDTVNRRVLRFAEDRSGAHSPEPLPQECAPRVDAAREVLCEAVAAADDALLEQYLEYFVLSDEVLAGGLASAVRAQRVVPILVASAGLRIGAAELLDAISRFAAPHGARRPRVLGDDGHPAALPEDGAVVAQVLSAHVDEDGAPYHLLKVWAGGAAGADWVDCDTGAPRRLRKFYRVRGPRRAVAPELCPGLIVATWELGTAAVGATLTTGPRLRIDRPPARPPMSTLDVRPAVPTQSVDLERALALLVRADRGLALSPPARPGDGWHLSGHDEDHLRIALERLVRWSGVRVRTGLPSIGFVEAPISSVSGAEGVYLLRDADGLPAAFGRCEVDLAPVDPTIGVTFVDGMGDEEDDLPLRFRGPVEEGVRVAASRGPLAGLPVVGAAFSLQNGDYDMLVSTDEHLRAAGERAAAAALERAGTRVLEPWRQVDVRAPSPTLGDLIADLTAHRGRILGLQMDDQDVVLSAEAPYRELRTYGARLRGLTSGRGWFELSATHYEPAPEWLVPEANASGAVAEDRGPRSASSVPPKAGGAARRRAAGR